MAMLMVTALGVLGRLQQSQARLKLFAENWTYESSARSKRAYQILHYDQKHAHKCDMLTNKCNNTTTFQASAATVPQATCLRWCHVG